MKLKMLFAAMVVSMAASAQTESDPVVMTVNGKPVFACVIKMILIDRTVRFLLTIDVAVHSSAAYRAF